MSIKKSKSSYRSKKTKFLDRREISKGLRDLLKHAESLTENEKKQIQNFIDQYLPDWDVNGEKFFKELLDQHKSLYLIWGLKGIPIEEAEERAKLMYILMIKQFIEIPEDKEIIIYRGLPIDNIDEVIWDAVGIHWSVSKYVANKMAIVPRIGGVQHGVVLTSKIKKNMINWKETLLNNISMLFNELEYTIKKGQSIFVTQVEDIDFGGERMIEGERTTLFTTNKVEKKKKYFKTE